MKIQVILTSSYPLGNAGTNRTHYICKGLIEAGASVELLITNPTESVFGERNLKSAGVFDQVVFRYINNKLVRSNNIITRKLVDIWCHLATLFLVMRNQEGFNYFIVIGTLIDFRLVLPFLKYFNDAKFVLEINEYPFVTRKNNFFNLMRKFALFRIIFPLYDGFIVISNPLKNLINQYKSQSGFTTVIPILTDDISPKSFSESVLANPYILHAGPLSEDKDGILGMIMAYKIALEQLTNPVKFVITGEIRRSPEHTRVMDMIEKFDLSSSVIFTGYLSRQDLESYLTNASMAIINKKDNQQNRFCFPTKVGDYLKFGVPLIITSIGEIASYFEDGVNAYVVDPDDPRKIASKIVQIMNNPDEAKLIAQKAKMLLKKEFNYSHQGLRLYDQFRG